MIVVIPVYSGDTAAVQRNLEWCLRMDKKAPFKAVISTESGCDIDSILPLARSYFADVEVFRYLGWTGSKQWPIPQNYAWRHIARYMPQLRSHWLWWESDAVPIKAQWLQTLEDEYQRQKKPFMGAWMQYDGHSYMAGVGIYPSEVCLFCPNVFSHIPYPWDVVLGNRIQRNCANTNLIQHCVEPQSFHNGQDVAGVIKNETVLFHKCKDGSLVSALNQLFFSGEKDEPETRESDKPEPIEISNPPKKTLLDTIKSILKPVKPKIEIKEFPVTTVITNFKRPDLVMTAFNSAMAAGSQHIVISGSGCDAKSYSAYDKIRALKPDVVIDAIEDDRGCNEMWLRGIRLAETEYIHILHDDDTVEPEFYSMVNRLNYQVNFAFCGGNVVGIKGTRLDKGFVGLKGTPEGALPVSILFNCLMKKGMHTFSPVAGIFRREHAVAVLEYAEKIKGDFELRPGLMIGNDLLLWLVACFRHQTFYYNPKPLVNYGAWVGSATYSDQHNRTNKLIPLYDKMRLHWSKWLLSAASGRKLIHCVERHKDDNPPMRKLLTRESWERLYLTGKVFPVYFDEPYPRDSSQIGCHRKLPYVKDVVSNALKYASEQDGILLSNDDGILHSQIPWEVWRWLDKQGAVVSHRCDFKVNKYPGKELPPEEMARVSDAEVYGRDLFAFTVPWLRKYWNDYPDFIISGPCWDNSLAAYIRCLLGNSSTQNRNKLSGNCWDNEMPAGYVSHIWHEPQWFKNQENGDDVTNRHDRELARQLFAKLYPNMEFDDANHL